MPQIAATAASYPFIYSADDRIDLGRMLERHYPDPHHRLGAWAEGFIRSNPTGTQALLADLNAGVSRSISYQSRETEGTQTPIESALSWLGFLPRSCHAVDRGSAQPRFWSTGRDGVSPQSIGGEPFHGRRDHHTLGPTFTFPAPAGLPMTRPTRTIGGSNLIRVAVTRDISQAVPVAGSFVGASDDYFGMTVEVVVA